MSRVVMKKKRKRARAPAALAARLCTRLFVCLCNQMPALCDRSPRPSRSGASAGVPLGQAFVRRVFPLRYLNARRLPSRRPLSAGPADAVSPTAARRTLFTPALYHPAWPSLRCTSAVLSAPCTLLLAAMHLCARLHKGHCISTGRKPGQMLLLVPHSPCPHPNTALQ